jgi:hypothetical protein
MPASCKNFIVARLLERILAAVAAAFSFGMVMGSAFGLKVADLGCRVVRLGVDLSAGLDVDLGVCSVVMRHLIET